MDCSSNIVRIWQSFRTFLLVLARTSHILEGHQTSYPNDHLTAGVEHTNITTYYQVTAQIIEVVLLSWHTFSCQPQEVLYIKLKLIEIDPEDELPAPSFQRHFTYTVWSNVAKLISTILLLKGVQILQFSGSRPQHLDIITIDLSTLISWQSCRSISVGWVLMLCVNKVSCRSPSSERIQGPPQTVPSLRNPCGPQTQYQPKIGRSLPEQLYLPRICQVDHFYRTCPVSFQCHLDNMCGILLDCRSIWCLCRRYEASI